MDKVKQVILARKDLNMSPGKLASQVAHASVKVIIDSMCDIRILDPASQSGMVESWGIVKTEAFREWINKSFTKVVLAVSDEKELLSLLELAKQENLPNSLILDEGRTEFGSVATYTCGAIGPEFCHKIDKITKHLHLY